MAVLNPPVALPGVAYVIAKFLHVRGAKVSRDALAPLLSPFQEPEVVLKPSANLGGTLAVMESLGILTGKKTVTLADGFAAQLDGDVSRSSFEAAIRRTIVDAGRDSEDPWENDSSEGGRDIARALTWFLAQPANGEPLGFGVAEPHDADARQLDELRAAGPNTRAIINIEHWRPFRRWSTFLGLATPARVAIAGKMTDVLEPIPVGAIAAELQKTDSGQQPLPAVLNELRVAMPYLPGGRTAKQLEHRLGAAIDPDEREGFLASSLAESLLLLESRGSITLTALADAAGVQLRDDTRTRAVTHITVKEVAA
jgi:hypothetical protein